MNGSDGSVLRRPDSEEPVEYDGVCYLFMATLSDVDPFVGQVGKLDSTQVVAGWREIRGCTGWGCVRNSSLQYEWTQSSSHPIDDLVLWPSEGEARDRYDDGRLDWDSFVVLRLRIRQLDGKPPAACNRQVGFYDEAST